VLVDRPALRPVLPAAGLPPRDGSPCPAPACRAGDLRRLLPALATALHLRTAGAGRHLRPDVRPADGLRQTLQPGAVAAYHPVGDHLGDVRQSHPLAVLAWPAARLDGADRHFRADHLATPLHRRTHRGAGRLLLLMVIAAAGRYAAEADTPGQRSTPLATGAALQPRSA